MERNINEELLKKIQKLLALATSSNENESSVAAQKAQELIVKYNIDMQQMSDKFEYEWHVMAQEPYLRMHQKFILPILKDFFFVKTLLVPKWTGKFTKTGARVFKTELKILGTPTNVVIADYIFNYLSETYQRLWLEYKQANNLTEKQRQPYYLGLTNGLREKLALTRATSEDSKAAELAERAQIALSDAKALVVIKADKGLEAEFAKIRTKAHKSAGFGRDEDVESDGAVAGRNININRPVEHKGNGGKVFHLDFKKS